MCREQGQKRTEWFRFLDSSVSQKYHISTHFSTKIGIFDDLRCILLKLGNKTA